MKKKRNEMKKKRREMDVLVTEEIPKLKNAPALRARRKSRGSTNRNRRLKAGDNSAHGE